MSAAILFFFLFLVLLALQVLVARATRARAAVEDLALAPPARRPQPAQVVAAPPHRVAPVRPTTRQHEMGGAAASERPALRQAVVMMEILGPPLALREPRRSP